MATRDRREYNKQWHEANKDKVSERKRDSAQHRASRRVSQVSVHHHAKKRNR